MKVAFVNPAYHYPVARQAEGPPFLTRIWPPLEMANVAGMLRRNFPRIEVSIIDANALNLQPRQVLRSLEDSGVIVISTAAFDRWQCPNPDIHPSASYAKVIRTALPESEILIIGPHGTARPNWVLRNFPSPSVVVRGEPEFTLMCLIKNFYEGKDFREIEGISYIDEGGIVNNPARSFSQDLDAFTVPSFDLLPIHKYDYPILGKPFSLVETSRGCPFSCNFCLKSMHGSQYRTKNVENVMRELKYLYYELKVPNVYFLDLEFTLRMDRVEGLCDSITKDGMDLHWTCQTRPDQVNEHLLEVMRRSGCQLIHYGVESGNERTLKLMRKDLSLKQIKDAIKATRRANILSAVFILLGYPGEKLEDMERSIQFAREINPDFVSFHVVTPYSGTDLYESLRKDVEGEPFSAAYMCEDWTIDDLERIRQKAFREFYFRPRYILSKSSLLRRLSPRELMRDIRILLSHIR